MPIQLGCPHCDKEYNLPDTAKGKTLRCKECQGTFVVEAPEDAEQAIKGGLKKSAALERLLEDDDDKPKKKPQGSGLPLGLLAGGLVGIVVICGGFLGGMYYLFNLGSSAIENAQSKLKSQLDAGNGPKVDPKLPPMDQALARLDGNDAHQQEEAARWLFKDAKPDASKKGEVGQRLERVLRSSAPPGTLAATARAAEVWGTPECVEPLLALVKHNDHGVRAAAMETLGNLKNVRAVEAITAQLSVPQDRDAALKALEAIGSAGEPGVLPLFNHPDPRVMERARAVLKSYGTKDAAILPQCVADLRSEEGNTRTNAVNWLAAAPPNDKYRDEVGKALVPVLEQGGRKGRDGREAAIKILTTWKAASPDHTLVLVPLTKERNNTIREGTLDLLLQLKDERAVEGLCDRLNEPFYKEKAKVVEILKATGAPAEKTVAAKCLKGRSRTEAFDILKQIGTKESIAELKAVAKDKKFKTAAEDAIKAIEARGN